MLTYVSTSVIKITMLKSYLTSCVFLNDVKCAMLYNTFLVVYDIFDHATHVDHLLEVSQNACHLI